MVLEIWQSGNSLQLDEDHYIYFKKSNEKFVIFSVFVDDILLAENDKEFVKIIKKWMSSNFKMKDMNKVDYVLRVKIHRDRLKMVIALSQQLYIKKILECFKMKNCNPIETPVSKDEL